MLCMAVLALNLGDSAQNGKFACQNMEHLVVKSSEHGLDPALMISLIHHESRWKPQAISRSGACGLTQVVPRWTGGRASGGKKYTCNDLKQPRTSIAAGTQILSFWIKSYGKGNIKIGLCGYNAGYRCKGSSPNVSGMNYSRKVQRTQRKIKRHIHQLKEREKLDASK